MGLARGFLRADGEGRVDRWGLGLVEKWLQLMQHVSHAEGQDRMLGALLPLTVVVGCVQAADIVVHEALQGSLAVLRVDEKRSEKR